MLEIKGKVNSAICFANIIEEEAIDQIRRMCDYDLTKDSKIRIMPDVHAGKGSTIGTTMTIIDKVCPNIVGVDIGCGMLTIKLKEKELDLEKIDSIAHYIPSGIDVWENKICDFDLTTLRCYKYLHNVDRLNCSLGTLGGGNHFIEIDKGEDQSYYLIIHSGSRNLGKQVALYYQTVAISLHTKRDEYTRKRDSIIERLKEEGREYDIQNELLLLEKEYENIEPTIPSDLCYLYGKPLEDYLHDVEICQKFAKLSREKMGGVILNMAGLNSLESFHTIHNYIDTSEMILRKGAIAAHKGEKILIPINMRDGSVIAIGKGNQDWNFSAPHGAGRIMSRTKAKELISLDEYIESMKGIYTTSVNEKTLDEAPMAYKSIDDIIDVIKESVDIIDIMKPVYNFKAEDDDTPWKEKKLKI